MNKKSLTVPALAVLLLLAGCRTKTGETNSSDQPGDPTAVRVSAADMSASEPNIASDREGNLYVLYVEHGADKSADVYLQKFDKEAEPVGERVRVNPEKGRAKAWFGDPPTIRVGGDGSIYVGWTAGVESAEKPAANLLFLSVSRDGGKTFDAPVKVNDDDRPASHGMHSLGIGKDDRIFMAWLDERNIPPEPHGGGNEMNHEEAEPNSEVFFAFSNDGGRTFSENAKIAGEVCPCCKTNLALGETGRIYLSWRQVLPGGFRHIAVASSENGGESFSAPVIVSDDRWKIDACPVSGAPMLTGPGDRLKIFWYAAGEAGPAGLYAAESTDGGRKFSPRSPVYQGEVKGTVSVFAKNETDLGAVFDGAGKIFQTGSASDPAEKFAGELPAAVFAGGHIYAAFVKKEKGKNGVFLARL
ncbi:MAG: hypothetical protein R2747_20695 [Pyrinomonadaceae bacterium]